MNKQLWLILLIAGLNSAGLTIVIPLFPFLLRLYVPVEEIAPYLGILVSLYAVCKLFTAPIMGSLSDYFGRKPILLVSLLGTAAGYFILGIGGALWVLFVGRMIAGIAAGDLGALYAYVADSSQGKTRTKFYGYLGAANGIGFMISPAIGKPKKIGKIYRKLRNFYALQKCLSSFYHLEKEQQLDTFRRKLDRRGDS